MCVCLLTIICLVSFIFGSCGPPYIRGLDQTTSLPAETLTGGVLRGRQFPACVHLGRRWAALSRSARTPSPLPLHAVLAFSPKSVHLTKTLRMGRKYGMKEAADDHGSPSSTEREHRLNMDLRTRGVSSSACGEQRQRSTKRMEENARVVA